MSRWLDDLSEIPIIRGSTLGTVTTGLIIYNICIGSIVIIQAYQGKMDSPLQGYIIGFLALATSATLFSLLVAQGDD